MGLNSGLCAVFPGTVECRCACVCVSVRVWESERPIRGQCLFQTQWLHTVRCTHMLWIYRSRQCRLGVINQNKYAAMYASAESFSV